MSQFIRSSVLVKLLDVWFERNATICYENYQLKGGWEGWLQVELAKEIKSKGVSIEREVRIFQESEKKVDMVVNWSETDLSILLELKAEGKYRTESKSSTDNPFFTEFEYDVNRLKQSRRKREFRQNPALCIGVFFSFSIKSTISNQRPSDELYPIVPNIKGKQALSGSKRKREEGVTPFYSEKESYMKYYPCNLKPKRFMQVVFIKI